MKLTASAILLVWTLLLPGCTPREETDLRLPPGWESDSRDRWWQAQTDTAEAFRDLETLESMGVHLTPIVYDATISPSVQGRIGQDRIIRYVKQSLLPLFRNRPDVVDSLFEAYVSPKIRRAPGSGDPAGLVAKFKREGYRAIYRHFHEPRTRLRIGVDIPVEIPDSLVTVAAGRSVSFQVYVSDTGEPVALKRITSVHPVLDRIALVATSRMRWQPAYLLQGQKSIAIPSWSRFKIRFPG
jgi:hypothetical protein